MYMNMAFDNVCFKGSIVSPSARFVYLCLCKHADNNNQTCFPSLARIAEIVGKSISTVKRAVRELCKYGAIERNPRFRKDGGQTSNLYKVAQVDLGALVKLEKSCKNEEIELEKILDEQIDNQDKNTNDISFSESSPVPNDEPASCACKSIEDEKYQDNSNIEESISNEFENDIQDLESYSEAELIHTYTAPQEKYDTEIDAAVQTSSIIQDNEGGSIETKSRLSNKCKVLYIKKTVTKFLKTISNRILSCKNHFSSNNEPGGGHGRPSKNLSI